MTDTVGYVLVRRRSLSKGSAFVDYAEEQSEKNGVAEVTD